MATEDAVLQTLVLKHPIRTGSGGEGFKLESESVQRIAKLEEICNQLKQDSVSMRSDFKYKRWCDNLAHARDREELDTFTNRRNENNILMTGLECHTAQPDDYHLELT